MQRSKKSSTSTHLHYDLIKAEISELMESRLMAAAKKYAYAGDDIKGVVQWKPIVLVIGNYSAGKSTFINHLLGKEIQRTGQAPTDDNFSVIRYASNDAGEREGRVLLSDDALPFKRLKSQGEHFLAHFRLKQVNSDILRNIDIIDSPGMLDSVSEKDRGYNYFEVIGELASIADLVLLLFDAHKAGTVRESYLSLRDILPKFTGEDRIQFVLNRVDECQNMDDLLRVYGALCWNLSQMTGRKDIPRIFITYASTDPELGHVSDPLLQAYLKEVAHQKREIIECIFHVPRKRMDHLATCVENHGHRLRLLLTLLRVYKQRKRVVYVRLFSYCVPVVVALIFAYNILQSSSSFAGGWFVGIGRWLERTIERVFSLSGLLLLAGLGVAVGMVGYTLYGYYKLYFQKNFFKHISRYLPLSTQYDKDHLPQVLAAARKLIQDKEYVIPSVGELKADHRELVKLEKDMARIRKIIGEIKISSKASLLAQKLASASSSNVSNASNNVGAGGVGAGGHVANANISVPKREVDEASTLHQIINKQVDIMEEISTANEIEEIDEAEEVEETEEEEATFSEEKTQPPRSFASNGSDASGAKEEVS